MRGDGLMLIDVGNDTGSPSARGMDARAYHRRASEPTAEKRIEPAAPLSSRRPPPLVGSLAYGLGDIDLFKF
jgi:hypothetical protein